LLGGWKAFAWAWPAIGFLFFMIPLPFSLENALANPLRRVATSCSTYFLQTLGFPAFAEGNVIRLNEVRIGVVEACNGLSMLMVFFALATAVALVIQRPLADRLTLVVSAVPIALIANVLRITITGILHKTTSSAVADTFFHDFAGWLMMPLALGLLWLELKYLELLLPVGPPQLAIELPLAGAGVDTSTRETPADRAHQSPSPRSSSTTCSPSS
jgi:exosortase